jgi:hypothetical protein
MLANLQYTHVLHFRRNVITVWRSARQLPMHTLRHQVRITLIYLKDVVLLNAESLSAPAKHLIMSVLPLFLFSVQGVGRFVTKMLGERLARQTSA